MSQMTTDDNASSSGDRRPFSAGRFEAKATNAHRAAGIAVAAAIMRAAGLTPATVGGGGGIRAGSGGRTAASPAGRSAVTAASGERLGRVLDRAVAGRGAGLRRERMHAKRPEGPALGG